MASPPQPPHDDALNELDWEALHEAARRLLRRRMSGFSAQEVEDATQDVVKSMVEFVRRRGRPESPAGLLVSIARAVAADAIWSRQRERRVGERTKNEALGPLPAGSDEADILEEYHQIVFHVREYFRLKRAGCLPLADAKAQGESLKHYAERLGQSHAQVRQAWARCVRLIHDAIRKNRLRLTWFIPGRREAPGD